MERYPYKKNIRDPHLANALDLNERRKALSQEKREALDRRYNRRGKIALAMMGLGLLGAAKYGLSAEEVRTPHGSDQNMEIEHTVQPGENLTRIAHDYFGDTNVVPIVDYWTDNQSANIQIGQGLKLEVPPEYQDELKAVHPEIFQTEVAEK